MKGPKYHDDTLDDTLANRIITLLIEDPSMTQGALAEKTIVSVPSIKRAMKILSDNGKIVRKDGKRYGYWEINKNDGMTSGYKDLCYDTNGAMRHFRMI